MLFTHYQTPNLTSHSDLPNPSQPNMPVKWTAERDQRLLLLVLDQVKVDANAVAAAWKANYGKWRQTPSWIMAAD